MSSAEPHVFAGFQHQSQYVIYAIGDDILADVSYVNGNLKLTPFTLKQQSKIDPFDDLLRLNLWLNSYSLFIF